MSHVTLALERLEDEARTVMELVVDDADYPPGLVAAAFIAYGQHVTPGQVVAFRQAAAGRRKAIWGSTRPGATDA